MIDIELASVKRSDTVAQSVSCHDIIKVHKQPATPIRYVELTHTVLAMPYLD